VCVASETPTVIVLFLPILIMVWKKFLIYSMDIENVERGGVV
jgi:hypothetical protein